MDGSAGERADDPFDDPRLHAFLASLSRGDVLTGTVAAIERFGVFVALDDGPPHPVFPGVGFVTVPELSWEWLEAVTDAVRVGKRVRGEFLQFDMRNMEARLSLRALQPDPFQAYADVVSVGQQVSGTVSKLADFGAFVRVAEGVEGLVRLGELSTSPVERAADVVRVGEVVRVVITAVDRENRRLSLSRRWCD